MAKREAGKHFSICRGLKFDKDDFNKLFKLLKQWDVWDNVMISNFNFLLSRFLFGAGSLIGFEEDCII